MENSELNLDEITKRCEKATKGTWIAYVEGRDHTSGSSFIMTTDEHGNRGNDLEILGATEADFDFIAHAKQDIPLLIKEINHLRKILHQK